MATTSDEAAIRRVLTRWMQLDDSYADEEWITGILTEDFVLHAGDLRVEGRAAARELNDRRAAGPPRGKHILSEPNIEVNGDEAVAITDYLYVTGSAEAGYTITTAGQYRDELVRDPAGAWRVRRRTNTHMSVPAGAPS
ncbi:nuclear transport factor 2 family protein [Pseudonocardia thermophila]|uniref:nuclear transport factor 2 family protein n=1 Tax=Pseudonocardia thermophila TaxID=1848 RepID=UPI00248E357E|nr:nuclear transport factor 2 family protein [Pseudonocardia thermophila]